MIPLAMVVLDKLSDRSPEVAVPERNQPIQERFLDRPHEILSVVRGASESEPRERSGTCLSAL